MPREYQRYRIDCKAPGGEWETFWDEMAFDGREALRFVLMSPGAEQRREAGFEFRAVAEAGELFGTWNVTTGRNHETQPIQTD